MKHEFSLACPICRSEVEVEGESGLCRQHGHRFRRAGGIWRFLPITREVQFRDFLREYHTVRTAEGWGSPNPPYYRRLPHVPRDDPQRHIWEIRERSFEGLLRLLGRSTGRTILDAGAGNGWLSYQLTRRGHTVAALDLADDARDGLGARVNYDAHFECYQAEFDRLPFADAEFDRVIFNAALHYSQNLDSTLCEARRVLKPGARIVVLDSPFYSDPASGAAMIAEREARFAREFGFKREVRAIGFLTAAGLERAAGEAELGLSIHPVDSGAAMGLRRFWPRRRAGREQAAFPIFVLTKLNYDSDAGHPGA